MISRIWLINGVLVIAFFFCTMKIWDVWHENSEIFSGQVSISDKKQTKSVKLTPERRLESESQYAGIVDNHLFSPDRAAAPPALAGIDLENQEVEAEVKISGERVELYGVIMLDAYKKALTNDPSDRTVKFRWIMEGDKIGNLAVREIAKDTILLTDREKAYRVLLYDPEKSKKTAQKTDKTSSPQIVSVDAPKIEVPKSISPQPSSKKSESSGNSSGGAGAKSDEGEYKIIQTPFGEIKRKIQ